ncbi:hypothetical protein T4A_5278 [Trichinella pseudospiralis]|uniref:Uncharacterized protein n=1 Tax=Trichinella pseudospiralis TaxID=6337 RepID=A0A0V1EFP1_TRIPS|nr:hypothetical protein T4A_5278 [Trichinella pseudospiralis]
MKIFNLVQLLQSDKRENGEEKKIEMQMTPYKISIDGTKQIKTKPRGMYDRYPEKDKMKTRTTRSRSRTRRSRSRTTRSRSVE